MQKQATSTPNHHEARQRANDTARRPAAGYRSVFPAGSTARIFRSSRSVMTSGKPRTKPWRLVFERRTAPFIEPLMGWTGGDDPLTQVQLEFSTLDAAIAYAQRQGLSYVIQGGAQEQDIRRDTAPSRQDDFSSALWSRVHLSWMLRGYGYGANVKDPFTAISDPASIFAAPMDVVNEPGLTFAEKRALLKNWAWNEYLLDVATSEGMPENGRPSRMDEVELALLLLEQRAAAADSHFVLPSKKQGHEV